MFSFASLFLFKAYYFLFCLLLFVLETWRRLGFLFFFKFLVRGAYSVQWFIIAWVYARGFMGLTIKHYEWDFVLTFKYGDVHDCGGLAMLVMWQCYWGIIAGLESHCLRFVIKWQWCSMLGNMSTFGNFGFSYCSSGFTDENLGQYHGDWKQIYHLSDFFGTGWRSVFLVTSWHIYQKAYAVLSVFLPVVFYSMSVSTTRVWYPLRRRNSGGRKGDLGFYNVFPCSPVLQAMHGMACSLSRCDGTSPAMSDFGLPSRLRGVSSQSSAFSGGLMHR